MYIYCTVRILYIAYLWLSCVPMFSCIGESLLLEVTVGGIAEAFSKNEGAVGKGVKAHFEVDHNGLLLLNEVSSIEELSRHMHANREIHA